MFIQKILNEKIIERKFYLEKIEKFFDSPIIKVLIGQRRVGKSFILKSIIQKYIKNGKFQKENIFYINKELSIFDEIKDYESLKKLFEEFLKIKKEGKIFVGIDEIQEIKGFEKFINSILAEFHDKIEIFITGSNAFLLSSELSTYLTGRYVEFEIFSLSFYEYSIFKNKERTKDLFLEYIKFGGLPAIFSMNFEEEVIFSYLNSVYNTIILKDIIYFREVRNIVFFKDLYKYVLKNIGNIVNGNNIKKYLQSQKISLGNETILNFLHYAEETFILSKVYSVEPESKKYFEIYNKYYVGDLGLRNALVGFDLKSDIGKILENYVYLELKRRGYEIKIGRLKNGKEIDFIATKNGITKYFQVCYLLSSEETIEREYSALESINDNWEKFVVSFDDIDFGNHNGIKHIKIMDLENIL